MEEVQHDLAADDAPQLGEHPLALPRVLDERVLLRHLPQVDALAQHLHVLEVLAPAHVDDLQDDVALELAHQLRPEVLFLRLVLVAGVGLELLDQRLAGDLSEILAQLLRRDLRLVELGQRLSERLEIPPLGVLVLGEELDRVLDDLLDPELDLVGEVLPVEHLAPLLVDPPAVPIEDVVVLQRVLADDEVLLLDLLLRALDLPREDLRLHGLVLGDLEALHDSLDPVAGEEPDEVVLTGEVEACFAGISLAAGAASELIVDPARLVALSAEDVEAARLDDSFAELDVDTAPRHVGGDRDRAGLAGILDDLGLARVLLRVEDVVLDALADQELGEVLGRLDGDGAHEDGLTLVHPLLDVAHDRGELPLLRLEDEVVLVGASDRDVRGDLDDVEVVDLDELLLLGLSGAGHAGELLVEAEVVLQRDRGERLVLLLDLHALLRLDGLVEALAPAASLHDPAGELVDDLHLAVLDHVLDVVVVERFRLEGLVEVVDELRVLRRVEVVDPQRALDLRHALRRHAHRLELLVELEVGAGGLGRSLRVARRGAERDQLLRHAGEVVVELGGRLGLAGDDERRPRLVDQDRVDLVHDSVGVPALDETLLRDRHVVAQVVEAKFGVRPVRDVGRIRGIALIERHHRLDVGDAHAERLEDGTVPFAVPLGEVVVDRDEVHSAAGEAVEVEGEARHERLALAGLHLGDVAFVEDDSTHELHVEHALARRALAGLADGRERLEDEVVEALAVLEPLPELRRLALEVGGGQLLEVGLERGDVGGLLLEPPDTTALADAENLLEVAYLHGSRVAA